MKTLDTTVKDLLEKRRGDWKAIADEADVSHSWLSKFVRGKIPNPGSRTLAKVHEAMLKQQKARA
jgi:transcriptional regulator with XRE-family HTH domain